MEELINPLNLSSQQTKKIFCLCSRPIINRYYQQGIRNVLTNMTRHYSQVIPVRFTHHQLAQIDEQAAKLNLYRSTLIRRSALDNLSKLSAQADASNEQAFPLASQEVIRMT